MCGVCRLGCGQRASVSRVCTEGVQRGAGQQPQRPASTPTPVAQQQLLPQVGIVTQQKPLLIQQRLQSLTKPALEQFGQVFEQAFKSRNATAGVLQRLKLEVPVHAGTLPRLRPGRQPRSGRRQLRC